MVFANMHPVILIITTKVDPLATKVLVGNMSVGLTMINMGPDKYLNYF